MSRRSGPARAALTAVAFCASLALGCRAPEGPTLECPGCNVVLVLVDTLRADHVGAYGYDRPTTPALDAFAERSILFDSARSQSACTFPSVNSLLTSRYPSRFLDPATRPGIPADLPTLPAVLAEHGYATAAVSASPVVRRSPSRVNPVGGFGGGFERFDEQCEWRRSDCVQLRAERQLETLRPPFFLYLHYMDPHDPYRPPDDLDGTFATAYDGPHDFVRDGDPNPIARLIREEAADGVITDDDLRHLIDRYDEMILSFDRGFGQLIAALDAAGRLEDTIVVVASDHGEAFREHGWVKHCYSVFDNEIRVPLILYVPGVEGRRVARVPAQNLDLVPTLLDLLGIDTAGYGFDGASLRPAITGRAPPERVSFSTMGTYRSVNDSRYKLILDLRRGRFSLFDLIADPGERDDRMERERRHFRRLEQRLLEWGRSTEEQDGDKALRWADEVEKELRALGYLG